MAECSNIENHVRLSEAEESGESHDGREDSSSERPGGGEQERTNEGRETLVEDDSE